jgi:UDP-N-acetylmuramoyl-L-alanyl-D-glutamate--2,6-diaminopimelate ligase
MKFSELLSVSGINVIDRGGDADPVVNDIVYDSRRVKSGSLYVAVSGMKVHGDMFIGQAVKDGAVAVVSENRQEKISVPWAAVSEVRTAVGALGRALWGIDTRAFVSVGVTGTNGKTTTAYLFRNLFDCMYGKEYSWMFGTVENRLGANLISASHTTPESVDIFRYISESRIKPKGLCMEVSSHSLALKRIAGMEYDVALWTNLTQDHLDFHGTMDDYYAAKKLLFTDYLKPDGCGVINIDDKYGKKLYEELKAEKKLLTYGKNDSADVRIVDSKCDWNGSNVTVDYKGQVFAFASTLRGFFNIYNMAAMIAGAFALNVDTKIIAAALSAVGTVPGRMDRVNIDAPFTVVVDYAHTPDALINILKTSAEITDGRLICVFGCGGDRDKTKRPLMAKAVAENCDETVITSDNPRSEKPEAIIGDILKGMPLDFPHVVIADRREAIRAALRRARGGDCVVIAGKGHETYQEICGTRHHFDDREEAVKIYEEIAKSDAA